MKRAFKPRPNGFTLVEILVVIAILTLLMSLLLPVVVRARKSAQKAICLANIRHLALANHMYAQDHDGLFVLAGEDMWGANLKRWHGGRENMNTAFDPRRGPLSPYMGSEGLKECPCFRREFDFSDRAGQAAAFEAGCGGYGYNDVYVGGRYDLFGCAPEAVKHSARIEDIRDPSRTVMFADAAYVTGQGASRNKIAYSFCHPPFWQLQPGPASAMRPNPTIDFRHLGYCNVAWADGHASSERMAFTLSYQTHSLITGREAEDCGVGWFGPEDNSLFDLK